MHPYKAGCEWLLANLLQVSNDSWPRVKHSLYSLPECRRAAVSQFCKDAMSVLHHRLGQSLGVGGGRLLGLKGCMVILPCQGRVHGGGQPAQVGGNSDEFLRPTVRLLAAAGEIVPKAFRAGEPGMHCGDHA